MTDLTTVDSYTEFVRATEPRLRQALCASLGTEVGVEATAEALAFGWEHWHRIRTMESPVGYLYGVARNKARAWRRRRRPPRLPVPPASHMPHVEPALPEALARLSERQRTAVMLVHCFDWTYAEAASTLGVSKSTVQQHAERGLARLRRDLGEDR